MGDSCPACRAAGHYATQLQLARLQEENRRLREALRLIDGVAQQRPPQFNAIGRLVEISTILDNTPRGSEGVRDREASRA
jgi:hypothetical protein